MNRTIPEAVRAMLSDSKLPKTFWAEAVSTAVHVNNRSPTSAHKNLTHHQALNGHKPNVQHFRTFGCMAYAHVPEDEREKLDSKSKTCVLLGAKYKMKDLGKLSYFLGVSVMQTKNEVFLELSAYTKALLSRFGMDNAHSVATPVDVNADLVTTLDEVEECDKDLYQSAVGSLLYLSTRMRPDITFAVNNVAEYCSKPLKNHWTGVKRLFRYLKGTSELGILYSNCSDKCVGYSDADWAGDKSDRKSTSGYCFTLSNSVITWRSVKQSCVALLTAEAEYVALADAAHEAIWLKQLLDNLEFKTGGPMVVNEDNQSAICLAQNPKYHGRSKHIDIKFHYVRDLVRNKEIDLLYCPSNDMLADIFTKGLSAEKFSRLISKLGVVSFEKYIQCEKEC
ncbi:Reverse transcriptase RNA-dependent DNA polymerase [Trinorchestia longiramus]|nr:Reverse transcriptase RNA-dependent DNA polymerase [Trinorchestia longiramus]